MENTNKKNRTLLLYLYRLTNLNQFSSTSIVKSSTTLWWEILKRLAHYKRDIFKSLIRTLTTTFTFIFGDIIWDQKKKSFWNFIATLHFRAFEVGFAPRTVLRQVALAFLLQGYYLTSRSIWKFLREYVLCSPEAKRLRDLMRTAPDYNSWRVAAEKLDHLQGNDVWKKTAPSSVYDWRRLEQKLGHFEDLMLQRASKIEAPSSSDAICSEERLLFSLRAGLRRDQCGLGHPLLYSKAHVGTKELIEQYTAQMANLLQSVVESPELTSDAKLAFLHQTRHSYGRTALLLTGGATMGLFHMGMVKALVDQKLLPRIISGASAGSIVASMVACKNEQELAGMFDPFAYKHFNMLGTMEELVGGERVNPVWARLKNLMKKGVLFDTQVLESFLRDQIGDLTFQEAYDRSGMVLNITVEPSNPGPGLSRKPQLLNYLTFPQVLVWSAAVASCAIPGVFSPVALLAKDAQGVIVPHSVVGEKYSDGSFGSDLPIQRLKELFNVNLFIVSQTNPISLAIGNNWLDEVGVVAFFIRFLKNQATAFLRNLWRTDYLRWVPILRAVIPTLTQDMEGDITWVAPITLGDVARIIDNPSPARVQDIMVRGERNVWPLISQIDTRCLIEFALDDCIQQVRTQVLEEAICWGNMRVEDMTSHNRLQVMGKLRSFSSNMSRMSVAELAAVCNGLDTQGHVSTSISGGELSITLANKRRNRSDDVLSDGCAPDSPSTPSRTALWVNGEL